MTHMQVPSLILPPLLLASRSNVDCTASSFGVPGLYLSPVELAGLQGTNEYDTTDIAGNALADIRVVLALDTSAVLERASCTSGKAQKGKHPVSQDESLRMDRAEQILIV